MLTVSCGRTFTPRIPRPSGGIGRRAALKMRYRKVCGFESHLGHNKSPRQRRFCFNLCTKLAVASCDGLGRGLWPVRRRGLFRWGAGPGPWLVGFPTDELAVCASSFRFCWVGRSGPTPFHAPGEWERYEVPLIGARPYKVGEFRATQGAALAIVRPKGVWTFCPAPRPPDGPYSSHGCCIHGPLG